MDSKRLTPLAVWPALLMAVACQLIAQPCLFGAEGKRPPQKWALLVGIDEYTTLPGLGFAGADQRDLAAQLVRSGFPADHVIVMHDEARKKGLLPFKANIERQLELLLDPSRGLVEKGDLVIVSFSGHGVSPKGKSYLCPTEAKEEDPVATMIPLENVYQQLDRSRAALKLLVVDACRSDPTRAAGGKTMSRGFAASLRTLPKGLLLLTSCGEGQVAFEEPSFGHGVFMHFVLDGLAGKAADEDGDVTLTGLYSYASSHTKKYVAQKFSSFQTPALEGKIDDDFELCRIDVQPKIPSPATPPPANPVPVPVIVPVPSPAPPGAAPPATAGKVLTNSIGMKLALIPAGEFMMGSTEDEIDENLKRPENEVRHRVRITRPLYLGVCEVTQAEYQAVMGKNPSEFSATGRQKDKVKAIDSSRFPVENVSWEDAQEFLRRLSQKEGKQYRLPTEAEWEYGCRAGTTGPFSFGEACNGSEANCDGSGPYGTTTEGPNLDRTTTVGSYRPNSFGLYDMHGNVREWCSDWYVEKNYSGSRLENPEGPSGGSDRVIRGGGWSHDPFNCRSAVRDGYDPSVRSSDSGFRACLVP